MKIDESIMMAFTPEEDEAGLTDYMINAIRTLNKKMCEIEGDNCFYDIIVTSDGYCTILKAVARYFDRDDENAKAIFLAPDEVVMQEEYVKDENGDYEIVYSFDGEPEKYHLVEKE